MNSKLVINAMALMSMLLTLSTPASARSIVKGQVVDMETGQPIEGAVVAINWIRHKFGPPGLPSEIVFKESAEDVSDASGLFEVPKYSTLINKYHMCAYKKGYVCWTDWKIFPTWEERKDFKLKNDMVIQLEPFKKQYSSKDHARFTVFMGRRCTARGIVAFGKAIESEERLYHGK